MRRFNLYNNIRGYIRRAGLKNQSFTLISDNCWAGFVYQDFSLSYNTPFIGLFLYTPCYVLLLENFDEMMASELHFIKPEDSRYVDEMKKEGLVGKYPVGLLMGKVEIHFLHYKSEDEAYRKWNHRKRRIDKDNMLVKMVDRDFCTEELVARFDALPFKHKYCFSSKEYPAYPSVITFGEFKGMKNVEREWKYYKRYMNIKEILNQLKQ